MAQPVKTIQKASTKKPTTAPVDDTPLFGGQNKMLMAVGAAIIILGMILMAGGKSTDPHVFNDKEVYSTTRITVAPILIILGILVEIFAIFRKGPAQEN